MHTRSKRHQAAPRQEQGASPACAGDGIGRAEAAASGPSGSASGKRQRARGSRWVASLWGRSWGMVGPAVFGRDLGSRKPMLVGPACMSDGGLFASVRRNKKIPPRKPAGASEIATGSVADLPNILGQCSILGPVCAQNSGRRSRSSSCRSPGTVLSIKSIQSGHGHSSCHGR